MKISIRASINRHEGRCIGLKRIPFKGGLVLAILGLMSLTILAGCARELEPAWSTSGKSAAIPAAPREVFQGGARLKAEPLAIDFGTVREWTPVKTVFTLENIGDSPLRIEKAITKVVEGCCPPNPILSSTTISPGKKAVLTLEFTMHDEMAGPHLFQVLVQSNDAVSPKSTLEVKGTFTRH